MIGEDYTRWLFRRYGSDGYSDLFHILARKDYIWQMVLDSNRASAGVALRSQYAYETGIYQSDVADGPCSVLEMLCALSTEMYDNCGQCDERYFMNELLKNLGLDYFRGHLDFPAENRINYILDQWLNRNYSSDGSGSIFKIPGTRTDLRSLDVWSQMNLYLSTYYPLDKNFLKSEG